MPFTKAFQNRLKKIAAHVALKDMGAARYDSQLLVRDFGTHVITDIDAGAALVKVVPSYDSTLHIVLSCPSPLSWEYTD